MGEEKVSVKEKDTTGTGTDTELEKPDLTRIGKYCQQHGINSNLIMLKITLFVMYGGTYLSYFIACIDFHVLFEKMGIGHLKFETDESKIPVCSIKLLMIY